MVDYYVQAMNSNYWRNVALRWICFTTAMLYNFHSFRVERLWDVKLWIEISCLVQKLGSQDDLLVFKPYSYSISLARPTMLGFVFLQKSMGTHKSQWRTYMSRAVKESVFNTFTFGTLRSWLWLKVGAAGAEQSIVYKICGNLMGSAAASGFGEMQGEIRAWRVTCEWCICSYITQIITIETGHHDYYYFN